MNNLFERRNTRKLSEEQIRLLPIHRLKAYRKKLLKVIHQNSFCECCGEPLKYLYPNDDYTEVDEMQSILDCVNKVFAEHSRMG